MSDREEPADHAQPSVLARIVAAHGRQAAAARDRSALLTPAWDRALRHAAVPFAGLELVPRRTDVAEHVDLARALDGLPEHGLIAVLEDRDGARGLIALSHGAVDALVEVQTTGRVDTRELPPRPVTRIDEALCRDFIDLCLAAFSRETQSMADCDWPQRLNFGSRIADRKQLGLLLPERVYHVMSADLALGQEGMRGGRATLILPRTRDPAPRAPAATGIAPEAWRAALVAAMAGARLSLEATLVRTTRSLREVEALGPGDLIGFEASDLASVCLQTPEGKTVLRGRLGQIGGQRALRMTGGAADRVPPMAPQPASPGHDMQRPGRQVSPPPPAVAAPDPMGAAAPPPAGCPDEVAPEAAPLPFAPQTVPIDPAAFPD
ncbi:MAG: flagellar motor switch protein FliM [Rhodobacteraceae bacterium HLUCCO18]|nr:MAG: flagellar motor switch protein FliM [Rhodobacteraceae bacterium HLUCCO18]